MPLWWYAATNDRRKRDNDENEHQVLDIQYPTFELLRTTISPFNFGCNFRTAAGTVSIVCPKSVGLLGKIKGSTLLKGKFRKCFGALY